VWRGHQYRALRRRNSEYPGIEDRVTDNLAGLVPVIKQLSLQLTVQQAQLSQAITITAFKLPKLGLSSFCS